VIEIIHTVVKVLLACAIIVLCFWLFKHHGRASIESNDKSMDALNFPEGGYGFTATNTYKSGDFVAYRISSDANLHIARVIGVEGNRVQVTSKDVLVNGAPLGVQIQTRAWTIPETKVPRGCAYILADDPSGTDSKQFGPVPYASIAGTVKPAR